MVFIETWILLKNIHQYMKHMNIIAPNTIYMTDLISWI